MSKEFKKQTVSRKVTVTYDYDTLVKAAGIGISQMYSTEPDQIIQLDKKSIFSMIHDQALSHGDKLNYEWEYHVQERNPLTWESINAIAEKLVEWAFFRQSWTYDDNKLVEDYCAERDRLRQESLASQNDSPSD